MGIYLTADEYRYLREIIIAVADGHQPALREQALVIPDGSLREVTAYERQYTSAAAVCLAATARFLSTTPTPMAPLALEHLLNRRIVDINRDLHTLETLERAYQAEGVVMLPLHYGEEREQALQVLSCRAMEPGWVDMEAFDASMSTDPKEGRNLSIVRDVFLGRHTMASAAREHGITPSRIKEIVSKECRRMCHPSYHGTWMHVYAREGGKWNIEHIHFEGGRGSDGMLEWVGSYDGITLPQAYLQLKAFFASLGAKLQLRVRYAPDVVANRSPLHTRWVSTPLWRGRWLLRQLGTTDRTLAELSSKVGVPVKTLRETLIEELEVVKAWAKPLNLPYVEKVGDDDYSDWEVIGLRGKAVYRRTSLPNLLQCLTQYLKNLGLEPVTYYARKYHLPFP